MGTQLSVSLQDWRNPLESPITDRPSTFDPHAGFPNGRKPRVFKASWEELNNLQVPPGFRDYCAHLYIPVVKCMRANAPIFAGRFCQDLRRDYDHCEYEDALIRTKEYERERRLLQRRQRKIKAGTYTYPENRYLEKSEESKPKVEQKIEKTPQQIIAEKEGVAETAQQILDRPEAQKSEHPVVGGINE